MPEQKIIYIYYGSSSASWLEESIEQKLLPYFNKGYKVKQILHAKESALFILLDKSKDEL